MANKIIQLKDGEDNVYPISVEEHSQYIKFPNGILIQWGVVDVVTPADTGKANGYATFPIPFVNTNFSLTLGANTLSENRAMTGLGFNKTKNTNNFHWYWYNADQAGYGTTGFDWIAIGKWK